MIVLNTEGFSDEFKDTAPKECAIIYQAVYQKIHINN